MLQTSIACLHRKFFTAYATFWHTLQLCFLLTQLYSFLLLFLFSPGIYFYKHCIIFIIILDHNTFLVCVIYICNFAQKYSLIFSTNIFFIFLYSLLYVLNGFYSRLNKHLLHSVLFLFFGMTFQMNENSFEATGKIVAQNDKTEWKFLFHFRSQYST